MKRYDGIVARPLAGQVALVAGATRGAGRGIAVELGAAGAVVYCTGRSSRSVRRPTGPRRSPFDLARRPETIEDTADRVTAHGGTGIPVRVDHTDPAQVAALVARIRKTHGRLDVLVNDIWGSDELTEWGTPFWKLDLEKGFVLMKRGIDTHLITSLAAVPLMIPRRRGLVVEVTDGAGLHYRGNLFYDLTKLAVTRVAFGMAEELRPKGIAAVAVSPGFLRSEAMLDHFGVTEATWRDGIRKDPHFAHSETPRFVGRGVAALAADRSMRKYAGRVLGSWQLARVYGFRDVDGRRPDWGKHAATAAFGRVERRSAARFLAGLR